MEEEETYSAMRNKRNHTQDQGLGGGASCGRAIRSARRRDAIGAQKLVVMGSRGRIIRSAWVRGPARTFPESTSAGAPRGGRGGAMLLGSFGRMWPRPWCGRAKRAGMP
ncbi:hypothetical protein PIB30_075612 [Stylosanthes scabra]|uniref:Uncharacterized protein n=1 Tax=Stylosanthes scabra TaxID=79078 RepID=A0ABU6ZNT9_9FABA|nr:hypothetical protein [Stylosanthes scabra]